jgi:hypothetical protein
MFNASVPLKINITLRTQFFKSYRMIVLLLILAYIWVHMNIQKFFWQFNIFNQPFSAKTISYIFDMGSLHSSFNCLVMVGTIPVYSRGLLKDLKYLISLGSCGRCETKERKVTTNVSLVSATDRHNSAPAFKRIQVWIKIFWFCWSLLGM